MQTMDQVGQATVAYYPLKGDTREVTGKGVDGVAGGNVTYGPGPYGLAATFATPGEGITIALPAGDPQVVTGFVLSAWVFLAACAPVAGDRATVGRIVGPLSVSYETGLLELLVRFADSDGGFVDKVCPSTSALPVGTWTHVLAMYDIEDGEVCLYLNGRLDSRTQQSSAGAALPDVSCIGGGAAVPETFNGSIGDVFLIETALEMDFVNALAGVMNFTVTGQQRRRGGDAADDADPEALLLPLLFAVFVGVAIVSIGVEMAIVDDVVSQPSWHDRPLDEIASTIQAIVGSPARAGARATRAQVGISPLRTIHLDLGGLGYYQEKDLSWAGFGDAINVNWLATNPSSLIKDLPVPNLVLVDDWNRLPDLPFGPAFADYVTMQSAPLEDHYVPQIDRIVRPGGSVGLWIDTERYAPQIAALAQLFGCQVVQCTGPNLGLDEFAGRYALPKILLTKNTPSPPPS